MNYDIIKHTIENGEAMGTPLSAKEIAKLILENQTGVSVGKQRATMDHDIIKYAIETNIYVCPPVKWASDVKFFNHEIWKLAREYPRRVSISEQAYIDEAVVNCHKHAEKNIKKHQNEIDVILKAKLKKRKSGWEKEVAHSQELRSSHDEKSKRLYKVCSKKAIYRTEIKNEMNRSYNIDSNLISMNLEKSHWISRSQYDVLIDQGYNVNKEMAKYLENFIDGDWVTVFYWFSATFYEVDKKDAMEMAKWLVGPLKELMEAKGITELRKLPFSAIIFGTFVSKFIKKEITATMGKIVLERMIDGEELEEILKDDAFKVSSGDEMGALVDKIIKDNPQQVADLKDGKDKLLGWLVGQIMKESKGKANAGEVNKMIREKLEL